MKSAEGMAAAFSSCEPLCDTSATEMADGFEAVMSQAAANALQAGCADGDAGVLNLAQFESNLTVASVEAIATVLLEVRPRGYDCVAVSYQHHHRVAVSNHHHHHHDL